MVEGVAMKGPPDAQQSAQGLSDAPKTYGDSDEPTGLLLTEIAEGDREAEQKVAKAALQLWESKDALMERAICQWKVNAARRRGIANTKVLYNDQDEHWTAYIPRNASADVTPDVNKAASP
jgi:hypothetical protein